MQDNTNIALFHVKFQFWHLEILDIHNATSANGAMSKLDISNNKLTRGKLKDGRSGHIDSHYETDMSGVVALSEVLKK